MISMPGWINEEEEENLASYHATSRYGNLSIMRRVVKGNAERLCFQSQHLMLAPASSVRDAHLLYDNTAQAVSNKDDRNECRASLLPTVSEQLQKLMRAVPDHMRARGPFDRCVIAIRQDPDAGEVVRQEIRGPERVVIVVGGFPGVDIVATQTMDQDDAVRSWTDVSNICHASSTGHGY